MEQWHFIINPVSGKGKGIKIWDSVQRRLDKDNIPYSYSISKYHGHSIDLVCEKANAGINNFIGIGGDGTMNEALNGMLKSSYPNKEKMILGLIPVGTGNDWVKSLPSVLNTANLCDKITSKNVIDHRVGVTHVLETGSIRYFLNVAGGGLDGQVVYELEHQNQNTKKTKWNYLMSALKALINYRSAEFKILKDQNAGHIEKLLFFTASIGKYFGGGMLVSPEADYSGNELSLTKAGKASLIKVLPQLTKLFNGQVENISFVKKYSAKKVRLEVGSPIRIQVDGEYFGESKEIEFSLNKNPIKILV